MIKTNERMRDVEYTATIQGNTPSKSNCYKKVPNGIIKSAALRKYEESFIWQAGKLRDLGIAGPFEFYIDVYYPSKRSDLDNSLKVVLDSLERIKAITNDNNCCLIHARKFIDKEKPRIDIRIVEV